MFKAEANNYSTLFNLSTLKYIIYKNIWIETDGERVVDGTEDLGDFEIDYFSDELDRFLNLNDIHQDSEWFKADSIYQQLFSGIKDFLN